MTIKDKKILAIVGPTATGKSDLAVLLAKRFNGEVISADSRQVYKGLDIGTGKVTKKEMSGIPHHLLDVVSPKKVFTVADYKKLADEAIEDILAKGKLPILCGGTGLYIQAVIDNLAMPNVPPNIALRKELKDKAARDLFEILKRLDPRRARNIDKNNPVRLIRAIEIAKTIGQVPEYSLKGTIFDVLQIGLKLDMTELEGKIRTRLLKRIRRGMIGEVMHLKRSGLTWQRLHDLGLEYRFVAEYLKGDKSNEEMISGLETAIRQYAKRQMTWFKRDKRVVWFSPKDPEGIDQTVRNFLL